MKNTALQNLKPLQLGKLSVWPPVVLAPMAGITHYPFRKLCRKFGPCLTVSEMITSRPLVENNERTLNLAEFGPDEDPRSIQLYGIDPYYVGEAVKKLVTMGKVDHIDLNFGCPVKKITRRGGGAALPYKINLLKNIIQQAVKHAGNVPVTVKCRMGIDNDHLTYLDTGRIAQEEGCAAIALHARTAAQMYSGQANWEAIADLKNHIRHIPVLGNGDIFTAQHAIDMMASTGCDGVVIGRGCLGRPWLFKEINDLIHNREIIHPNLEQVVTVMLEHLNLMIDHFGEGPAILKFRKEACNYLKGFHSSTKLRAIIMTITSYNELRDLMYKQDLTEKYPVNVIDEPRGKTGRSQIVTLPYGYLDSRDDLYVVDKEAEINISGG